MIEGEKGASFPSDFFAVFRRNVRYNEGMSSRTLTLDEKHFRVAEEKARSLGKTLDDYLQSLIDADSLTFDEILQPVRQGFDAMSDAENDDMFDRAVKAVRQPTK